MAALDADVSFPKVGQKREKTATHCGFCDPKSDHLPIEPTVQDKQDCPEDSGHWEIFNDAIAYPVGS